MSEPKVTIVMANHNYGAYLPQALQSVLDQTLADYQLVIVDDGSTDDSRDVIERMLPLFDGRAEAVFQKNTGVAAARNEGLRRMRGRYVAFLDADDIWLNDTLAVLADYLDTHDEADAVYGDSELFESSSQRSLGNWFGPDSGRKPRHGRFADRLCLEGNFIPIDAALTRRSAILREGFFDPRRRVGEDWDFWVRIAAQSQIHYLDRVFCRIRRHSRNISFIPLNAFAQLVILRRLLSVQPALGAQIGSEALRAKWHRVHYDIGRVLILNRWPRRGRLFLQRALWIKADFFSTKIIAYFLASFVPYTEFASMIRHRWRVLIGKDCR